MHEPEDREALFAEASFHVEHVAFTRVVGEWMPVAHVGVSDKIYLVAGGRGEVLLEQGRYELRRGRVLLIPSGALQQGFTDDRSPVEKYWVHFSAWTGQSVQLLRFADLPTCIDGAPAARMIAIAERMLGEWRGRAVGRRLALRMHLLELLLIACRAPARNRRGPDGKGLVTTARRSMDDAHLRGVRRVITALATRYAQPITLKSLAADMGWTPAHLSESFKDLVGMPPVQFLEGVRMRKARELLTVSAEPVHRVAELVGFSDPNYFSRAFTRHTGVSPSRYRAAVTVSGPRKSRKRRNGVQ